MKKYLFFLFFIGAGVLQAQPLNTAVEAFLQNKVLDGAMWAGYASYPGGEELFSINPDVRMAPASTLKLITSAAALDAFGPFHRFETKIYTDNEPNEKGILTGNIYIQGGADPTLGSSRVKGSLDLADLMRLWVSKIKQAGIKQINGHIYADESLFEGPVLPIKTNWENMGNYYAAPASPLTIHDNMMKIYFKPQPKFYAPVEVSHTVPAIENLSIKSFVTTDPKNRKDNAYVYAAPKQYDLQIYGTIPDNKAGYSIGAAMPDPGLFAAAYFKNQLEENGIRVQGEALTLSQAPDYSVMQRVHTQLSPELKDIIYIVNKRSFNLYAELLLRQLAVKAGKKGSVKNGLAELESFLARNNIRTDNIKIYDGSGLSRDNMITARTMTQILNVMTTRPYFKYYYDSLADPNDRGDLLLLRRFLRPAKRIDYVRVKGGTIDGVKGFGGYVKDKRGNLIAFTVLANNLLSKTDESVYRIHENIIKLLLQEPKEIVDKKIYSRKP